LYQTISYRKSVNFVCQECFASNFVTGRRLIIIDASTLPKLGITDFMHIKVSIVHKY